MRFSTAFASVIALCIATLVSSSPIPVPQPGVEASAQPVAREADPQGCRMVNSCI
ncbi:hypothetical protein EST38_g4283 [Candolleomyces aberdarensis]|uniref:Uncharacterized protein n=1 Tax=Candolleomyces aberdarensis TaxID=2316362 RepID=A0A4Q2DRE5_9AGAR|nr:hypothetical protein EST38_g4283 [Candolleomyces aberdarensis]